MAAFGIIVVLLLIALVLVLVTGVVLMGIGGEKNKRYSNKLMVARIWLQGLVLLALAGMFVGH